jgi:hypothetical protein
MTPNTGPFDANIISDAVAAAFARIGPGIPITHSQGGGPWWLTALKSRNVRAVIAYEPRSGFLFPQGEVPAPKPSDTGPLEAVGMPPSEFKHLTKIPIVVYYGDNIPERPSNVLVRTTGASHSLWRAFGRIPSIGMVEMRRSCTFRKSTFTETRTSRFQT